MLSLVSDSLYSAFQFFKMSYNEGNLEFNDKQNTKFKIQDGRQPPSWKSSYLHVSIAYYYNNIMADEHHNQNMWQVDLVRVCVCIILCEWYFGEKWTVDLSVYAEFCTKMQCHITIMMITWQKCQTWVFNACLINARVQNLVMCNLIVCAIGSLANAILHYLLISQAGLGLKYVITVGFMIIS